MNSTDKYTNQVPSEQKTVDLVLKYASLQP
jgi:hypothetical protein